MIVYTFTVPGMAGGVWYAATFPLGSTGYYRTEGARDRALTDFTRAVRNVGAVRVIETEREGVSYAR